MPPTRLAAMRRSYERDGLDEADLAPTWVEQFARWLQDAISGDVLEPNAMVLATATGDGRPSARTVLLKAVDERGFVFFTDRGSRKGRELAANPWASLVFGWLALQRQVVVTGRVAPVGDEQSDEYFASRPRGSQLGASASAQSRVIGSREELSQARERLAAEHPEGTPVPRPPGWGGLRVAPDAVEFWQGRPDRLHDRLRYRRQDGGDWAIARLSP